MKEVLDLLKNFTIDHFLATLKMYRDLFLFRRNFWTDIQARSAGENIKLLLFNALFMTLLIGIVSINFDLALAFRSLFIVVIVYGVVCSLVIITTRLIISKFRNGGKIFGESTLYVLFVKMSTYPLGFLALRLFMSFEEYNVLFLYNCIIVANFFFLFFYCTRFFFTKKVTMAFAVILNIIFYNVSIFIPNQVLFTSKYSKREYWLQGFDPITEEYLRLHTCPLIATMPDFVYYYKSPQTKIFVKHVDNIPLVYYKYPLEDLLRAQYPIPIAVNNDSTNEKKYIDSLDKMIAADKFEFDKYKFSTLKDGIKAEVEFVDSIKSIFINPLDTTSSLVQFVAAATVTDSTTTQTDTAYVYCVLKISQLYFGSYLKSISDIRNKSAFAYYPIDMLRYLFYPKYFYVKKSQPADSKTSSN